MQTALIEAKPGDTVRLGAGVFTLTDGLTLDVDGVTLRGAGGDQTILDFKGQLGSGEGLLVTSDDVTLRQFGVRDTQGRRHQVEGRRPDRLQGDQGHLVRRPEGNQRRLRHLSGRRAATC